MKLILIVGQSGAGKTSTCQLFEDLDIDCIQNFPLELLPKIYESLSDGYDSDDTIAIAPDFRHISEYQPTVLAFIDRIKEDHPNSTVIFLDANEETLIKRYKACRRKHPFANESFQGLTEAIQAERKCLDKIRKQSDLIIDTSELNIHQFRDRLKTQFGYEQNTLKIIVQSFGFRHGTPNDCDYVFDVRFLPNPYWDENIRHLTGLDKEIEQFFEKHDIVNELISDIDTFIQKWLPSFTKDNRSYLTIGIGCTGGKHRSVYCSETLAKSLCKENSNCYTLHRDIHKK